MRILGVCRSSADAISKGMARLAKRASVSGPRPKCARMIASSTAPLTMPKLRHTVMILALRMRYFVLIIYYSAE